jgi:N-acetylglutamate synthase-like GNAT family acetyltransferase
MNLPEQIRNSTTESKFNGEGIEFRKALKTDYEAIRQFLAENGWEKRVADTEKFCQMMDKASRTVVALENNRVVGFARALCDDVSNGYIGTVAVAADFRRQGVGRALIEKLTGDDPGITWVLRAGRGSEKFWQKMGFSASDAAMEKKRSAF